VRIGPLWIGPPWLEPPLEALAVVIEPGRAFGTGAHPTTRLCIEILLDVERGSLLDVGCGSGVIAVAAGKLGFAPVGAVDIDPAAVEATRANAEANAVSIQANALDALDPAIELPASETTVANIALEPVRSLAARVGSPRLVTSGYLAADQPTLTGFRHVGRAETDGWAADLFSRE
jgi:ribosomal protein L11 methyltransferase